MNFDTREQTRIRTAFNAFVDRVELAPDLDYLIERASVARADAEPRRRPRSAMSGAFAVLALAAITGGALWISSAPTGSRAVTTGGDPAGGSIGDVSAPLGLADMPFLALELPGEWHSIDAFEEEGPDGGIRGIDYATTTEDDSGVTAQLRVYGFPMGSAAESAMWWAGREDYDVVSISSDDARLFTVDNQYLIVWRPGGPANVLVVLSVEAGPTTVTADAAIEIANALIELHSDAWHELIIVHSYEYQEGCLPDTGC